MTVIQLIEYRILNIHVRIISYYIDKIRIILIAYYIADNNRRSLLISVSDLDAPACVHRTSVAINT